MIISNTTSHKTLYELTHSFKYFLFFFLQPLNFKTLQFHRHKSYYRRFLFKKNSIYIISCIQSFELFLKFTLALIWQNLVLIVVKNRD